MPWRTSGLSPGALSAAPSLRSVSSPAVSLPKTVYLLSRLGSVPARGEKRGRHDCRAERRGDKQEQGAERAEADEELRARAVGVRATRLASVSVSVKVSVSVSVKVSVRVRVRVKVRLLGSELRAIESTPNSCLRSLNSAWFGLGPTATPLASLGGCGGGGARLG